MASIGRYKRVYLGLSATVLTLFGVLLAIGLQITADGDKYCLGTLNDPCMSYITIYNPTPKNIYVYNREDVTFKFDGGNLKDYAFFTKDGRCSATGKCACTLKDGTKYGVKGWRCTDFTNATKPRSDRKYVFLWQRYSVRKHLLVGFKESPSDTIKWTLRAPGDELDPVWFGDDSGMPTENTRGLMLYYHLDNNSNFGENATHVFDFSGNGNNGTIFGGDVFDQGILSDGFVLNSNPNRINLSDSSPFNYIGQLDSEWAFGFWLNFSSVDSAQRNIIRKEGDGVDVPAYCHKVTHGGVPTVRCKSYNGTIAPEVVATNLGSINDGILREFIFQKNNGKLELYVNGVLTDSATYSISNDINGSGKLEIFGAAYLSADTIDEVAIWNRSLTASEIKGLYLSYYDINLVSSSGKDLSQDDLYCYSRNHTTQVV